jgi:hypothetical protein
MKYAFPISLFILASILVSCTTPPVKKNHSTPPVKKNHGYLVHRDIPQSPTFSVRPQSFLSSGDYNKKQIVEEVLLKYGVRVVPYTVQSKEVRIEKGIGKTENASKINLDLMAASKVEAYTEYDYGPYDYLFVIQHSHGEESAYTRIELGPL